MDAKLGLGYTICIHKHKRQWTTSSSDSDDGEGLDVLSCKSSNIRRDQAKTNQTCRVRPLQGEYLVPSTSMSPRPSAYSPLGLWFKRFNPQFELSGVAFLPPRGGSGIPDKHLPEPALIAKPACAEASFDALGSHNDRRPLVQSLGLLYRRCEKSQHRHPV
jgi:hypothetical protein